MPINKVIETIITPRFVLPDYNVRPIEMSGAIGLEQLNKLPLFIEERRNNAFLFKELFATNPYYNTQKEIGRSSWFGFSFIIKPDAPFSRKEVIQKLQANQIDCRPIVAGNFVKNEVVKWFDYEIHDRLPNAELVDTHGFFVGNHHFDIREQLTELQKILMMK